MRRALLLACAAACFDPRFKDDIACAPGGECPPGLTCSARVCVAGSAPAIDARFDVPMSLPKDGPSVDVPLSPDAEILADALVPDGPLACPDDCQTPPDQCHTAGTCNHATGVCSFPILDCSGQADPCNDAVCDPTQGCVKVPAHTGDNCANTTCGAFGSCTGFSSACSEDDGMKSRTCTNFICQAGVCSGSDFTDTTGCSRDTDGATCPGLTSSGCPSGQQRNVCCSSGVCGTPCGTCECHTCLQ